MAELIEFFIPEDVVRAEKAVVGASTFYGFTRNLSANTSSAVWLIARETISGSDTELLWAGSGVFDQIWDDRVSLFANPPFQNERSIKFTGTNDRIDFGDVAYANFAHTDPFSVCAWFRTLKTGESVIVAKQGGGNSEGWRLIEQGNEARFHISGGANSDRIEVQSPNLSLADDNWHFVGFSYDGSADATNILCVVDGVDQTSSLDIIADTLSTTSANSDALSVGTRNLTAADFDGFIDEVSIHNVALSVADMQAIYNLGGTGQPGDLLSSGPSAANLVFWCRCGDNDSFPTISNLGTGGGSGTMTDMKASDIVGEVP